jgi:hypothetical protein
MELFGGWIDLPNSDAMEDTSLAKEPLFSPLDQPAQAERPMEQLA